MPISTGQCPNCHSINSYTAANCLECTMTLPWADAVISAQQQVQAAQQAAAQAKVALTTQSPNPTQAMTGRAQHVTPVANPMPINIYETYAGSFIGNWSAVFTDCNRDGALKVGLV